MNIPKYIGVNGLFLRKPGTGIGAVTHFFLTELQKRGGEDFSYILYTDDPDINFPVSGGSQVVCIKPWWKRDDLIRKLLWEHIQLPRQAMTDKVSHFLSLYQAPTEFPAPIQHTMVIHDLIPEVFPEYVANMRSRFMWNLTKRAVAKATALVAVSQSTKKDIIKHLSIAPEKITLAYPSINPIFFNETSDGETERVLGKYALTKGYIYHGGGLEIRKNTACLLTAYAAWRTVNEGKVPPLVISGLIHDAANSLATDVRGLITKLELEEAVRLLGFVPNEDLPALYQQAALFVFPSRYEGFGLPVVEALSQGTAVVAERNSSLGEVGGESVFWVETMTKDSLQANYQKAQSSSSEEKNVRKLQANNFSSWQHFTQKVIDTLL